MNYIVPLYISGEYSESQPEEEEKPEPTLEEISATYEFKTTEVVSEYSSEQVEHQKRIEDLEFKIKMVFKFFVLALVVLC